MLLHQVLLQKQPDNTIYGFAGLIILADTLHWRCQGLIYTQNGSEKCKPIFYYFFCVPLC